MTQKTNYFSLKKKVARELNYEPQKDGCSKSSLENLI